MALTPLSLCSKALTKCGESTISSFDEATAEAEVAGSLYDSTRDALLSLYPWTFATAQQVLALRTAAPVADYHYAHQLPHDFLRVLSVGNSGLQRGRGIDYRIRGKLIHSNVSDITLSYIYRPDESGFPPYFDGCLIARLAAAFCMPLTENSARTTMLEKRSEKEFALAKMVDSQQQPLTPFEDFSLISVRG